MKTLKHLFERNEQWASAITGRDPGYFQQLAEQQNPEILWIGCSDSRVAANQIIDLPPGQVFVHRNIANVVVHTDLNCLSVIHFAVEVLKVKHIVVCGHYGCGGIIAAMEDQHFGLIDNWLRHIKDVARFSSAQLAGLGKQEQINRMCELNVLEQMKNVCNTPIVQKSWQSGKELYVHGWIYDIKNGLLKDLGTVDS